MIPKQAKYESDREAILIKFAKQEDFKEGPTTNVMLFAGKVENGLFFEELHRFAVWERERKHFLARKNYRCYADSGERVRQYIKTII